MKAFLIFSVACFGAVVQAKLVEHRVESAETAWFVAQIYYGQGARYIEILKLNGLSSAEKVKPGLVLKIEDPKYNPEDKDFVLRLTELRKKRLEQLASRDVDGHVGKTVVVPAEKIRKSLGSNLPFSEVRDPQRSLQEKARDELKVRTSNSESN